MVIAIPDFVYIISLSDALKIWSFTFCPTMKSNPVFQTVSNCRNNMEIKICCFKFNY